MEIWSGGDRWTRTLADGAFLDGGSAEWRLSGGWRIDGQTVSRGQHMVWTSPRRVIAAASSGDTLWLVHLRGLTRLAGRARYTPLTSQPGRALAPLADGLAYAHGGEVVLLNARGRERCRANGGGSPSVASPDGRSVVVLGREGLAVRDLSCELIAGAPITGRSAGFIDPQQLLVLGTTGELIVLSWPELRELSRTAPVVDATWPLAQGPAGPVLVSGRFVYDPQSTTTLTLPEGSLMDPSTGLAFAPDGAGLQVLDLAGTVQQTIAPGLPGPPTATAIDGERIVLTDGSVVLQWTSDGPVDRWALPVDGLRLLPDGAVEAWAEDGEARWLLRPGEPPVAAPFLPEPAELVLPGGGRLPLALPEDAGSRTVVADAKSARVMDSATLELLGAPIPGWFELVALSPDGRLFVGVVGDRLRAYEVASARELWSAEVEPWLTDLTAFSGFVAAEGDNGTALFDVVTGARVWTLGTDTGRSPRSGNVSQIHGSAGLWRSDAWGGWTSHPQWPGSVLDLALPARGPILTEQVGAEEIAERSAKLGSIRTLPERLSAELCRVGLSREEPRVAAHLDTSCPPLPESWPPSASPQGGPAPPIRRFTPGPVIADGAVLYKVPLDGLPTAVLFGRTDELPSQDPAGVRVFRVVLDRPRDLSSERYSAVSTAIEQHFSLGPDRSAVLVGASGRELMRGSPEEVLAAAEDAGLEEVNGEPGPALAPTWTLRAPSTIERLALLPGAELLVATATSAAILASDGRVRVAPKATAPSGSPWFPVPGGWCLPAGTCTTTDPARTWPLSEGSATLTNRTLTAPTWQLDGVVRVLSLPDPGFLVQLGSEAGPWVLVDEAGRLGALLGHGHTAVVGEGMVGVARGEVLRVFAGRL